MRDAVLAYGRPRDAHVAAVGGELARRNVPFQVLPPRRYPVAASLTYAVGMRKPGRWSAGGLGFDVDDVGVGWIATQRSVGLSAELAPASRRFAKAAALQGVDSFLRGSPFPWVNDPDAATVADDKLRQLGLARGLGLTVPDTLATNDPAELRAFARLHGRLIAKSLSGSQGLPPAKRILTTVVTAKDLARGGLVRHAPVCFQEYVPKASELRVTVIGRKAHAVRIHSQEQARTRDDWRRYG